MKDHAIHMMCQFLAVKAATEIDAQQPIPFHGLFVHRVLTKGMGFYMSLWRVTAAVLIFFAVSYVRFFLPEVSPAITRTVEAVVQTDGLSPSWDQAP